MKLYTLAVYNWRMCMQEDNPGSREIISSTGLGYPL